jgi:hypothetical protein
MYGLHSKPGILLPEKKVNEHCISFDYVSILAFKIGLREIRWF